MSKKPHRNNKFSEPPVIIIGGGWSGLSCAVVLAAKGVPVLLLESARQLGGRARGVRLKHFSHTRHSDEKNTGFYSDNGHHIMLGAYHHVLELINILQLEEKEVLLRMPLELNLFTAGNDKYTLKSPRLPAPLHLIIALITANGFSLIDRANTLLMVLRLAAKHYTLKKDISVKTLLQQYSQSQDLISGLWEPLCLAALNTPIERASAQVFLLVLRDSFSRNRSDSDLLFFKHNLSHFLAVPASDFIERHGGQIRLASKVTQLHIENHQLNAVKLENEVIPARQVVMATPADITRQLFSHSAKLFQLIPCYQYEPICTIYLQYPEVVRLPSLMTGFINAVGHWAFEHSTLHQSTHDTHIKRSHTSVIAIVISGPGLHMQLDNRTLANQAHQELQQVVENLTDFSQFQVIREKKATFSCRVNIQENRPGCNTPINGLYLSGDYTDTGYPATLEGAVKSGFSAADAVINQ